ncbi:DUF1444 domain-containing protein [Rhodoferax ferrireducens]|uniref:DUF1444 domain-containing protein n=1 Tax=Rhodoferax ferrireducens TaxID=192843 RepID=UPI001E2D3011|nr:DUF1444 domain-containing protein [Rhodoferax ferrireducens]
MIGNWFGKRKTTGASAGTAPPPPPPYRADNVTLRIKHTDFLKALQAHGVPPEQMPVTRPLCGDLLVSYAFDTPDQFVMATPPLLAQAGVSLVDMEALVQANFKGMFSAQLMTKSNRAGLMQVRTGQDLEAVMLVFDSFWSDHVKSQVKGDIVVCAPRRNVLLIADTAVAGTLEALREEATLAFHQTRDAHALSLQMMQWTDAGWVLHAPVNTGAPA